MSMQSFLSSQESDKLTQTAILLVINSIHCYRNRSTLKGVIDYAEIDLHLRGHLKHS